MLGDFTNVSGLSIERLNTFCRVAEFGSIKGAADADPTRQSQYSRQIKDLEHALGVTLFDRGGKTWSLTEDGRRLVVISRGFFQSLAALQAAGSAAKFHLRIGSGDGVFAWYLASRLERIRQAAPKVSFECRNLRTNEIVRQLNEGEIDIGILRADAVDESLTVLPFITVEYSFFVPRNLLPGKSAAGFELLKELPMASLSGGGIFQRSVDRILTDVGIAPRPIIEGGSFVLLAHIMNAITLAGVLPTASKDAFSEERFAIIQLEALNELKRDLVIAINRELAANNPSIETVARQI